MNFYHEYSNRNMKIQTLERTNKSLYLFKQSQANIILPSGFNNVFNH